MAIDWEKIEEEFTNICELVEWFEVPTPEDFERFKLNLLTYGQVKSPYQDKINYAYTVHIQGDGRYEKLLDLAVELGFMEDIRQHIPDHFKEPIPDYREIVIEGLKKREVTTEFLSALSHFNFLAGRYAELIAFDDTSEKKFEQAVAGLRDNSMLIQMHWYAHWIHEHSPSLKQEDRAEAEFALARLCLDITKGKIPPFKPYPAEWFSRMLQTKKVKEPLCKEKEVPIDDLKTTYTQISQKKIREMLQHPLIIADTLPPVLQEELIPA